MFKMDNSGDFIQWLGPKISIKILTHLDDPSDVVRVSAVSRLWNQLGRLLVLFISFSVIIRLCLSASLTQVNYMLFTKI